MELKTKYQYTYFIYPYIIDEKDYRKYIENLLKKSNCKLKIFESKKDVGITSYFLPEMQEKMFWTLDLKREALKEYMKMDKQVKATLLSQKECNIFEFEIDNEIQGKVGEQDGIFFSIGDIQIVCFKTGVCFLVMKTTINSSNSFSDVLNFNYKFRDIYSQLTHTKEYENIKIQTEQFKDIKKISEVIREIVGPNTLSKQINLDTNRFITYAYTCIDQAHWNENSTEDIVNTQFKKYKMVQYAEEQLNDSLKEKNDTYEEKYLKIGFEPESVTLLTTDINIKNYTILPHDFENKYLYHYIFNLYKKVYLKKINYEINQKKTFLSVKEKFITFAKKDWIIEITNNNLGISLEKEFQKQQMLGEIFFKLKNKYDILYKDCEIEKNKKYSKWILTIVIILLIIGIFNLLK